jgi:hypothetical protein
LAAELAGSGQTAFDWNGKNRPFLDAMLMSHCAWLTDGGGGKTETTLAQGRAAPLSGYLYQCRYALLAALRQQTLTPGLQISIECFDDIAFSEDGSPVEMLQAKHSLTPKTMSDMEILENDWDLDQADRRPDRLFVLSSCTASLLAR